MEYIVNGGNKLHGELEIHGAKNCILALLGASVLTDDDIVITNCPQITDVDNMILLLQDLGKKVAYANETITVSGSINCDCLCDTNASKLRGSVLLLGGLLARCHKASVPLPGGCKIGSRPIDIHLDGFQNMGATVVFGENVVVSGVLHETSYTLRFPSVGATENLICASVFTKGITKLNNCATEPEVEALERFLISMGAKISGVGTSCVTICGVESLHGTVFEAIPDRIVTATYLSACACCGGDVVLNKCNPLHLKCLLHLFERFDVKVGNDYVRLNVDKKPRSFGKVVTAPYPGFPTDMQSLLLSVCASNTYGETTIVENMFENRLQHNANELRKLGAKINIVGNKACVTGKMLHAGNVSAGDLRGGASLVIACLSAQGESKISGVEHILRGYSSFEKDLQQLGAQIILV